MKIIGARNTVCTYYRPKRADNFRPGSARSKIFYEKIPVQSNNYLLKTFAYMIIYRRQVYKVSAGSWMGEGGGETGYLSQVPISRGAKIKNIFIINLNLKWSANRHAARIFFISRPTFSRFVPRLFILLHTLLNFNFLIY